MKYTVIALWLLLCISSSSAALPQKITIGGISTITAPPYGWIDQCSQQPVGSSRHLIRKFFSEIQIEVSFNQPVSIRSPQARRFFEDMKLNKFDAMLTSLDRPQPDIAYSKEPVVSIAGGILTRKEANLKLTNLDQLQGKKGVMAATESRVLSQEGIQSIKSHQLTIDNVDTLSIAINGVKTGEYDFAIAGRYRSKIQAIQLGLDSQLHFQELSKLNRHLYLSMNKTSPWTELLPQLDKRLLEYKNGGYVEHLERSYFFTWFKQSGCL